MGLYVISKDGADAVDKPEDVGIVIEGVELLRNLQSVSFGCAMLFSLIYTLNLSYLQKLKFTLPFYLFFDPTGFFGMCAPCWNC